MLLKIILVYIIIMHFQAEAIFTT